MWGVGRVGYMWNRFDYDALESSWVVDSMGGRVDGEVGGGVAGEVGGEVAGEVGGEVVGEMGMY